MVQMMEVWMVQMMGGTDGGGVEMKVVTDDEGVEMMGGTYDEGVVMQMLETMV